jgi:hypothetical protein
MSAVICLDDVGGLHVLLQFGRSYQPGQYLRLDDVAVSTVIYRPRRPAHS